LSERAFGEPERFSSDFHTSRRKKAHAFCSLGMPRAAAALLVQYGGCQRIGELLALSVGHVVLPEMCDPSSRRSRFLLLGACTHGTKVKREQTAEISDLWCVRAACFFWFAVGGPLALSWVWPIANGGPLSREWSPTWALLVLGSLRTRQGPGGRRKLYLTIFPSLLFKRLADGCILSLVEFIWTVPRH